MKKLAVIFILAIFAPAIFLGVLAVRAASRQGMIMREQEIELRQKETDELAERVRGLLSDEQRSFLDAVDRLRARLPASELGRQFAANLPAEWGCDCVGFAVDPEGVLLSPSESAPGAHEFLQNNAAFLGNQAPAEVYQPAQQNKLEITQQARNSLAGNYADAAAPEAPAAVERSRTRNLKKETSDYAALKAAAPAGATAPAEADESKAAPVRGAAGQMEDSLNQSKSPAGKDRGAASLDKAGAAAEKNGAETQAGHAFLPDRLLEQKYRAVAPQNSQGAAMALPVSQLNFASSKFRQIVSNGPNGVLARYVDDELVVVFWVHPAGMDNYVLGAQMKASALFHAIQAGLDPFSSRDACVAILDDRARPAATSISGFSAEWKAPFVATELGEILPHWEAALYQLHPGAVSQTAHVVTLTLYALAGLAIAAIGAGSLLIVTDTRRQLALAQKKTDFVSNVSHELKTPLTSIRMFAELLQERRVTDPAKTADYLRIIRVEAERLTRLINNVLDFARLERNQKHYTRRRLDIRPEVAGLWEAQAEHLRAQGFAVSAEVAPGPWMADVDTDAITQILVNLLSNAEKYSNGRKEIDLHGSIQRGEVHIAVLDRGAGVPAGEEKKIFQSFYRAHDSLSSGIPGSGLGLTLARRIARDHGGDILYEARPGGGSVFTLVLPLCPETTP